MKGERELLREKDMLHQIVRASDAIRRKHRMIKTGKDNAEQTMQNVFKPIVGPLNELVLHKNERLPMKGEIKEEVKKEKEEDEEDENIMDDASSEVNSDSTLEDISFQSAYDENDDHTTSIRNVDELINEHIVLLQKNRKTNLDVTYGVRILANDKLMIGDSPIIFHPRHILIRDKNYPKTVGLTELLFKKVPNVKNFTPNDLKNYENIVIATNAHKKFYKADEAIREDNSFKFRTYIMKIVDPHMGKGMPKYKVARMENTRFDYIYWDDPNELVDRLRLLHASQAAGNSSHSNEILSIIEELREAEIIY